MFAYLPKANYPGPVHVICGEKSPYVPKTHLPQMRRVFPNIDIENDISYIAGTGHWVHYEKPHEFRNLVLKFIKKVEKMIISP